MNYLVWSLIGGLLGWVASTCIGIRSRRGIFLNILVGMVGVLLGGWVLGGLIGSSAFHLDVLSLAGMLVSLLGAAVLLSAVQLLGGVAGRWAPGRPHPTPAVFEYSRYWNSHQSERTEMNTTIQAGRVLRPLIAVGLAGMLLLVAGCATAPG